MVKIKILICMFMLLFVQLNLQGQVNVSGSTGADGSYTTLKTAFDAINASVQTGNNITVVLTGNTDETASAVLNEGTWTSFMIYPSVTGVSVSGNLDAALIDLNGADNVTIDGRVNQAGNRDLVISNTDTSTTACTSTIRFINDASGNTIKYCIIKGSEVGLNVVDGVLNSGIIFFSTGLLTGNDNNILDHNDITNAGGSRPIYAVFSVGSSGMENSGNSLIGNNIFDIINTDNGGMISGTGSWIDLSDNMTGEVMLGSNNTAWTISGNSFYESNEISNQLVSIRLVCVLSGNGNNISNNFFGGSSVLCGGRWSIASGSYSYFTFIHLYAAAGTVNEIQGNTIKNISITDDAELLWEGIYVESGDVKVGTLTGNTIGSSTGTGSISINVTINTTPGSKSFGILIETPNTADVQNNVIGSITLSIFSTGSHSFFGITKGYVVSGGTVTTLPTSVTGNVIISNNTIGSTNTANSIYSTSAASSEFQIVSGIYCAGSSTNTISGNVISNVNNGTTNTTTGTTSRILGIYTISGANTISGNNVNNLQISNANNTPLNLASVIGIGLSYTSAGKTQNINSNTIYNLYNSYSTFSGSVIGLYYNGSATASSVTNNFIHSLYVTGASSTGGNIYGIKINAGSTTYSNNIISLGGNTKTTIYGIYGIAGANQTLKLYFNTVYLSGSLSSGTNKSYALYTTSSTSDTRNFKNNILMNARSTTSGTNLQYAAYIKPSTSSGILWCDYNDYYVSGTGGMLGCYNDVDVSAVPIVTGKDSNSVKVNPSFNIAKGNGTSAADFKPGVSITGVDGTGVTTDYSNYTRPTPPTLGSIEKDSPLPVSLLSFTYSMSSRDVKLRWMTSTEQNNAGFYIEKTDLKNNYADWNNIGFVKGMGNTSTPSVYNFTDANAVTGKYKYRLKQIDYIGNYEYYYLNSEVEVGIPAKFVLSQNYPNPFNPTTDIKYDLPKSGLVSLRVYDINGRLIKEIVNQKQVAGSYTARFDASNLSSGIYFYKLSAGEFKAQNKMVLIK